MKKAVHTFLLPLLAAICCFAIDMAGAVTLQKAVQKQGAETFYYSEGAFPKQLFGIPSEVESLARNITHAPPAFKNSFKGALAGTTIAELRLASFFSQYKFVYGDLLVRFRKTDLIFPFHYFW